MVKNNARVMKVFCQSCTTQLYAYRKGNPTGALVKCFDHNITRDYTEKRGECPGCGAEFARFARIRGKPCNMLIRGRYFVRGFSTFAAGGPLRAFQPPWFPPALVLGGRTATALG
jgi:hypothetical protein